MISAAPILKNATRLAIPGTDWLSLVVREFVATEPRQSHKPHILSEVAEVANSTIEHRTHRPIVELFAARDVREGTNLPRGRLSMPETPVSTESHLIDFSSPIGDSALSYHHRIKFGDITLARSALLPNSGIYIGAEQVIVARHCGPAVRLEWRSPDSDVLHSKPIVRGTVHIKSAGECFWQRWALPADVLVIAYDRNFFASLSTQAAGTDVELAGELGINDRKLGELSALFDQELLDDGVNGRFYVENLGAALAGFLVQRRTNRPAAVALPYAGLAPARLRRIVDYIDAHLTDDLGLTELSRISGLNPHYFAHAFKVTTGMPPHRFIIERRVDKARALLEDKRQSIADIALASGFASQSHFTQHFRRVLGTTPGRFRRDL